jgi:hypothetical protein
MFVTAPKKPIILRELLNKELTKGLHTYKNVSTSSDEEGFLNGVACARAYWKGKVTDSRYPGMIGPLAHGFIYVTWNPDTKTVNWIEGEDIDPDYSQTSKAMEAAALTLKPN